MSDLEVKVTDLEKIYIFRGKAPIRRVTLSCNSTCSDFLFVLLHTKSLLNRGLFLKERFCPPVGRGANSFLLE